MSNLTLEEIKAEHAKFAEKIAAFEQQATQRTLYIFREAQIELAPGERYAGVVLDADGAMSHHLVLLPGEAEDITWTDATEWARKAGGDLPTRSEQSLLYANLKPLFQPSWYWSSESHDADGSFAWGQYFINGTQTSNHKSYEGRAVAVRRFPA